MPVRATATAVVAYTSIGDARVLRCHVDVPVDTQPLERFLSRRGDFDFESPGLYAVQFDVVRDDVEAAHLPLAERERLPWEALHVVNVEIENITLRKLRAEAAREMGLVD